MKSRMTYKELLDILQKFLNFKGYHTAIFLDDAGYYVEHHRDTNRDCDCCTRKDFLWREESRWAIPNHKLIKELDDLVNTRKLYGWKEREETLYRQAQSRAETRARIEEMCYTDTEE